MTKDLIKTLIAEYQQYVTFAKAGVGACFFGVSGVSLSCELRVEPVFLGFRVSCSTMVRNGCGLKQ